MSFGGIVYFLHKLTPIISAIILLSPLLVMRPKIKTLKRLTLPKLPLTIYSKIAALIDIALIGIIIINRTDAFMTSPWSAVNKWFFISFAISTGLLVYEFLKHKKNAYLSISLHLFLLYSVAAIIYTLGYGFDGFIHRATQSWIATNGFIAPKQPFYLGQYSLIVMMAQVFNASIYYLDVFLVPLFTALFLPLAFLPITKGKSSIFAFIVPFIYFITLNLTTPHNVVILLTIIGVLAITNNNKKLAIASAITAVLTHPLPGVPLLFFVFASIYLQNKKKWVKKFGIITTFLLTSLAPTLMFSLQSLRAGNGLPGLTNPLLKISFFLELFARPYWYLKDAGFILNRLYDWQYSIGAIIMILGITGLVLTKKKLQTKITAAFFIGLWMSAWLLRTTIYFKDVAAYEQGNYPLRLTSISVLYLLPFMVIALQKIYKKIASYAIPYTKFIMSTVVGVILMVSFYFLYPQTNYKARFPGHNVTANDFEAVTWIHEQQNQHDDTSYIVLANPLVSVAALTKYSFLHHVNTSQGELFYYSIPTGGPLYQYYGDMLYKGQKNETMQQAMTLAGVDRAYFVLNAYWGNSQAIKNGALLSADNMHAIGDEVFVFVYERN